MCMASKDFAAVPPPPRRLSVLDHSHRKNLGTVYMVMKNAPSRWLFPRYQAVARPPRLPVYSSEPDYGVQPTYV